jgi:signal transduction histidine kinase
MTTEAAAPNHPDESAATEAELITPGLIHEMRHPLMGIKVGLHLMGEKLGAPLTSLEEWEIVRTQLARLDEIFETYQQFLSLERADPIDFDVEPLVVRALALLAFRLKRLGSRFSLVVERPLPAVRGHPQAVLHAVTNLVANALDALDEQRQPARLEVRLLAVPGAPERVQIRVADEGPGIPAEIRERIFEARFTTKAARNGTGLGLHLARRMMEAAGGTVTLLGAAAPGRRTWSRTEFAVDLAPREVTP